MKKQTYQQSMSHLSAVEQNLLCTCFSSSQLRLHLFPLLLSLTFFNQNSFSAVSVTPATNGSNLCSGVYNTLGNIVITEAANNDIAISQNNVTLILTAPTGYEFKVGVGSVSFAAGGDITAASISVVPATITVTFSTNGNPTAPDAITISGIQVTASVPSPPAASGNIQRTSGSPGTATITGITNSVTNFGTLTQSTTMIIVSSTVTQNNISGVATNSTNNEIIGIQIVTCGSTSPISATSFTLNTSGTDNPAVDISNAKVWYTAASSIFATTIPFGSLVASPNGTFTITGSQTLSEGTNYFWLTYDVPSGATNGNNIDAQCTSLIVGGSTKTPSVTDPSGVRGIGNMAYLSSTCVQITSSLAANTANNEILQIQVITKGGITPLSATSFTVNGNGTTSTVTDKIQNAKIFYTGTSNTFATTSQFGSTVTTPDAGNFNITGSRVLATGTNYFWLSFDTKIYGAPNIVVGDLIDGECSSIIVEGTPRTPTVTAPSGNRIAANNWIGITSIDWFIATNWASGAIPTSTTDVYIPSGTPFQPTINNTADCRDLSISSGATLTVSTALTPAKFFSIYGNILNNGTIIRTANEMRIMGDNMIHYLGGSGIWSTTDPDIANIDLVPQQGTLKLSSDVSIGSIQFAPDTVDLDKYTMEITKMYAAQASPPHPFKGSMGTLFININQSMQIIDLDYYNLKINAANLVDIIGNSNNPSITVRGDLMIYGATGTRVDYPLTVNGNIIINTEGKLSGNTQPIALKGEWTNNGTFIQSTSTVTFNGTIAQSIGGSSSTTFNNLTINNTSSSGITLQQNTNVSNTLTLTNAQLNLNSKNLTITNAATTAITRTNGFVLSETNMANNLSILQWNIGATTGAHIFPFGTTSGNYIPVTFNNSGAVGNISISTRPTSGNDNTPWATGVTSMTGTGTNITTAADRWWNITSSAASPLPSVNLTLSYLGSENVTTTSPTDTRGIQRWNSTSWDDGKGGANGSVTTSGNAGITSGVGTVSVTGLTYFSSPYVTVRASAPMGDLVIQNFYWVGGNGNWNDAAHWSTTSGGAGGAGIPDINTNVYIDNNSGTVTITIPAGTWDTKNFTMSGAGAKSPIIGQGSLLPRP